MFRRLRRPLLSLAIVVLLDLVFGWIFLGDGVFRRRRVPPFELRFVPLPSTRGASTLFVFDALLGWTVRPDTALPARGVHINSAGARGRREYNETKPDGVLRIGAFGDSYTFGDEVRDADSWCHLLERSRDGLEVMNFGVNAYGTDQAFLRYRDSTASFEFDVVLCGLMPKDALRNVNVYRPAYAHRSWSRIKPRFLLRNDGTLELLPNPARSWEHLRQLIESGALLELLMEHDYWVRRAPAAYEGSALFASSFARTLYAYYENRRDVSDLLMSTESEPFRVTVAVLRAMAEVAVSRGQRFYVVMLPETSDIEAEPRYWDRVTDALRTAGIPVIDCTPELLELHRKGGLRMPRGHYTPAGNAAVARVLAARIAAN